jgi:hypothetical protein
MKPQDILAFLLTVIIVIVGIWDSLAIITGNSHNTVSTILRAWSKGNPVLPFAVGLVVGHIFW